MEQKLKACICGRKTVHLSAPVLFDGKYANQLIWCPKCGRAVVGESLAEGYKRWNKQREFSLQSKVDKANERLKLHVISKRIVQRNLIGQY